MTIPAPASCPHELRPGTTRCLHCRSEARAAARARLRRSAARVGLASVVIAIVAVVANAGTTVLKMGDALPGPEGPGAPSRPSPSLAERPATPEPSTDPATAPAVPAAVHQGAPMYAARNSVVAAAAPTTPSASTPAASPATPPLAASRAMSGGIRPVQPRIPEGRTELRDSMFVVRSGDGVTVHFDTRDLRTRRAEKFESIVRSTLPRLYGPSVDSVLATIPVGQLVVGADLLTELPTRGVFVRVGDGSTIGIWPETRAGQDGPLVVNYRATLTH